MEEDDKMQELYDAMKRHPSAQAQNEEEPYNDFEMAIVRTINMYRKAVSK